MGESQTSQMIIIVLISRVIRLISLWNKQKLLIARWLREVSISARVQLHVKVDIKLENKEIAPTTTRMYLKLFYDSKALVGYTKSS